MATTPNAQFFVIVRNRESLELQQVPMTAALQSDLASDFQAQLATFLGDKTRIAFAPSYQPDKEELSLIDDYALPSFLKYAVTSPQQYSVLTVPFTPAAPIVKAILVAFPPEGTGQARYLFQYFDRRRILNTHKTLIFRRGEFARLSDPGVVIADHLDVALLGDELLFHSFHIASQFLPLHTYFEDATDEDIREFVGHKLFVGGKSNDVIASANDITRKRISMVLKAGTLGQPGLTAEGLQAAAKKFEIDLQLKGKSGKRRIVFPSDTSDVRLMLQLLAEGFYIGVISGEPYVANSYRKLRKP